MTASNTSFARRAARWRALACALLCSALSPGCASSGGHKGEGAERFVFVRLVTGPGGQNLSADERAKVFQGHMANINRLANEEKLVIAGPYAKPADTRWRGIFVMNVPTIDEAGPLVATDPGVVEGVFATEMYEMDASPRLRDAWRFEYELQAEAEAAKARGETVTTLRPFVMLTASDWPRAEAALERAGLMPTVAWWGRFTGGGTDLGGVYILDSTSADDIRARLAPFDPGRCAIDGWFSTSALARMRLAPVPASR